MIFFRKKSTALLNDNLCKRYHQHGISLNEFMLYSFLASLMITTVIIGYRELKASINHHCTIKAITGARANLMTQFSSTVDMSHASINHLITALPSAWSIDDKGMIRAGPLKNITVDFKPSTRHIGDGAIFFSGLTQNQCLNIFPKLGHGWVGAYAKNTAKVTDDSDMATVSFYGAVDSHQLEKQCTGTVNSVALVMSNHG